MAITVPELADLTDQQWELHDLPITGRYIITGGPGSGKTSIAIRRTEAIKLDNPNAPVLTLLFTNTLNDFFRASVEAIAIFETTITVWAKWQRNFLIKHGAWGYNFGDRVPWETLADQILALPLTKIYDNLIIDEAQDFSVSDLKVMNLIADNITVFADENQQLVDRGVSDIEIIKELLNIEEEDDHHLTENHRNTKQIMKAAVSLAPDEIDVKLDEVVRSGQKPRIVALQSFDHEIDYIAKVVRANKQKDIGILHMENKVIKRIYEALEINHSDLTFELMRENDFNWQGSDPKLCTLNSAKGLEFDIVLMPHMNKENYFSHPMNLKRIYVGMTRAREELHISYYGHYPTTYITQIDPSTVQKVC